MSAPAEFNPLDYICVGICRIDPESGSCLGCGRPPPPSPEPEPQVVAADACRYPVASELTLDVPAQASDAWEHLV
ncbi:MAG: hypothetical protein H6R17_2360 [Proteobacteria bacterium]|nr:hypothetical protein [Pseudomonadota bacterium]